MQWIVLEKYKYLDYLNLLKKRVVLGENMIEEKKT